MKKITLLPLLVLLLVPFFSSAQNEYTQRFLDLRAKMNNTANGYFSPDGVPYHAVESLIAEAPDHGHETTSEAYSYWIWMEVMYGKITGDWSPLNNAWSVMESKAIPTSAMQPTTGSYDPSSPATYAGEHPLPSGYPSPLESNAPVGQDPVSAELTTAYGSNIYAMHWLFDCDNFYGYGNLGDGVSTPSYINTFQRGPQESVWETVPHPSWEDFSWGNDDGSGFLKLFIDDPNPAKQWRYTNAPDADARAVQAMYWAIQFAKEQGKDPAAVLPTAKASKMGDFVRLAMFDKYFKPLGVQDKLGAGATGYGSAHYLLSWYFAWGGPLTSQGWAWRIGSSHNHFGYQNPVAAYALSELQELKPITPNGARDWGLSLQRQLEFYTWLQSAEGAIAGGATNSLNGDYSAYPAGTATFYDMVYQEHPVYHDPGSNEWFGMQAWSMERMAELYYITNNSMAKNLMDKWISWVKTEVKLLPDGDFEIPATLSWSGQPNTWDPVNPSANSNLHVTVSKYGKDLGIAGCLAKAITYYAAATQKYGILDTEARDLAKEILDRMWTNYYDPNGLGVAVEEKRGDFKRFFEQEVYVPSGFTGKMANGDTIKPGIKFIDIRSDYRSDPDFPALETAYNNGQDYTKKYHRYWAQADIALANAEYGRLFGDPGPPVAVTAVSVEPATLALAIGQTSNLTVIVSPFNATNKSVTWTSDNASVASVDSNGTVSALAVGSAAITATTVDGGFTDNCVVTVSTTPGYSLTVTTSGTGTVSLSPSSGTYDEGTVVTLTATPGTGFEFTGWSGDLTGATSPTTLTMDADKAVTATFAEIPPGCDAPASIILPFEQDGEGEFCWTTTGTINFVNSWNLQKLEINGVDFTNIWSNSMPPKVNGSYNIRYQASVGWAHAEINGTGGGTTIEYTLTTNTTGSGSVSLSPSGGTYSSGTVVTVTATPSAGYKFSGWSGDLSGSANPASITMDANKIVTATFTEVTTPVQYTLTTSTTGSGTIALIPSGGTYDEGTVVAVTATASSGYEFSGWSGDLAGVANPTSITMNANKSVTASFTQITGGGDCNFNAPLAAALPTLSNLSYSNVHVIGTGPDLSNVTKFTINWDLPNNGLYQLSMNTNDGQPNWYVDLRGSVTHNFNQPNPDAVISGSGFTGFDGNYWATVDGSNFVLVEKTNAHAVYFSNSAVPPCTSLKAADKDIIQPISSGFKIYPNPAEDYLRVEFETEQTGTLEIRNISGGLVQLKQINKNKSVGIDLKGLETGLYFITKRGSSLLPVRFSIK